MLVTTTRLTGGSLHLRLCEDGVDISKHQPYTAHTVLEPDELGERFLNGLDSKVDKSGFRKCIAIAEKEGSDYASKIRVKNGEKICGFLNGGTKFGLGKNERRKNIR